MSASPSPRQCQCCDRTAMVGTPAAADAIDPRNCPRCDHSFGIVLAGAYRLTEHFRGTDSPVWMEPVESVQPVESVPSADEVADGDDFAGWLEAAAGPVRARLDRSLNLPLPSRANSLVRIPHEPGETVACEPGDLPLLTETLTPAERHELDAFLADAFADRSAMCAEVYDAEALPETRGDGALYHGRVPSEDVDGFNPSIVARAPVMVPPQMDGQSVIPAWAYAPAGVA